MDLKKIARDVVTEDGKAETLDLLIGILNGNESAAEDAALPNLTKHDARFHGGHFDEEAFRAGKILCRLRDYLSKTDDPDAKVAEHEKRQESISNGKAREYVDLMRRKYPQLDPEEVLEQVAAIGDRKVQGDAFRWILKGKAKLPADAEKIAQARKLAEKAKKDPMAYESPQACIDTLGKNVKLKYGRIDPDTVPELTDKKTFPMGVTTYQVQDDKAGQLAMRKIINTHWGEDANPWCLLHGDDNGNLSDEDSYDAWYYWNKYSAIPKRVAFKDGKLLAFMATDGNDIGPLRSRYEDYAEDIRAHGYEVPSMARWIRHNGLENEVSEEWWDRNDHSHRGIPIGEVVMPDSKHGQKAEVEIVKGKVDYDPICEEGERGEAGYRSFDYRGNLEKVIDEVNGRGNIVRGEMYDDRLLKKYIDGDGLYVTMSMFDNDFKTVIYNDPTDDESDRYQALMDVDGDLRSVEVDGVTYNANENGGLTYDGRDCYVKFDRDGNFTSVASIDDVDGEHDYEKIKGILPRRTVASIEDGIAEARENIAEAMRTARNGKEKWPQAVKAIVEKSRANGYDDGFPGEWISQFTELFE